MPTGPQGGGAGTKGTSHAFVAPGADFRAPSAWCQGEKRSREARGNRGSAANLTGAGRHASPQLPSLLHPGRLLRALRLFPGELTLPQTRSTLGQRGRTGAIKHPRWQHPFHLQPSVLPPRTGAPRARELFQPRRVGLGEEARRRQNNKPRVTPSFLRKRCSGWHSASPLACLNPPR